MFQEDTQLAFWEGRLEEGALLAYRDADSAWYKNQMCLYHSMILFACRRDPRTTKSLGRKFTRYVVSWYHAIHLYRKAFELSIEQLDVLAEFLIDECYRWMWLPVVEKKIRNVLRRVVQMELIYAEQPDVDIKDRANALMTAAEVGDMLDDKDMVNVYLDSAMKLRADIEKQNTIQAERCLIHLFQRAASLMYSIGNIPKAYQWAVFASTRPMTGVAASVYQVEQMTPLLEEIRKKISVVPESPA